MANYPYAWRHSWGWIAYYLRHGRLLGALRQAYHALVCGHDGETCQFCGRRYPLWYAPDGLWHEVMGGSSGLSCPNCFDRRGERRGIWLHWSPELWEDYLARVELDYRMAEGLSPHMKG